MAKHIAAGGVVYRRTDGGVMILLVRDKYGHWTWPKGHLEGKETSEDGALREIREETGQSGTEIISKLGEQRYYYTLDGKEIDKTVHIFLVESHSEEIILQEEELAAAEWFSAEEALEKIEYEGSRELLEKGIEKIGE